MNCIFQQINQIILCKCKKLHPITVWTQTRTKECLPKNQMSLFLTINVTVNVFKKKKTAFAILTLPGLSDFLTEILKADVFITSEGFLRDTWIASLLFVATPLLVSWSCWMKLQRNCWGSESVLEQSHHGSWVWRCSDQHKPRCCRLLRSARTYSSHTVQLMSISHATAPKLQLPHFRNCRICCSWLV